MKVKECVKKIISYLSVAVLLLMTNFNVAYANTNFGQNIGKWGLDQLFWIALLGVIAILITAIVKKNIVGAITTLILGGILLYFIKTPTAIETIGKNLAKVFGF